jgi:hypothetical protein
MTEPRTPSKDWRVILTLVISALGILYFVVQAFALGIFGLTSLLDSVTGLPESLSISLLFWTSILGGLLLIPLLLMSVYRLRGDPPPGWLDTSQPGFGKWMRWVIFAWPAVVFLGWLVAGRGNLAVFLLGPINVLVAGLPVLWIFLTAQKGLSGGSPMRKWRIFGFSITLLPVIVIIAELFAMLFLAGVGGIWLMLRVSANPSMEREITYLINQITILGEDVDAIIQFLEPFLMQPSVLFWVLAIFAGVIPILEEILKPLALWTLAGRQITPQEGFVGGVLCGAGFALMENVFYFTTVLLAEDWLFMAIGRAGTGVLHMLASGLMGWGLAVAWQKGKLGFLGLTTFSAFVLHGLWNAFALISGLAPFLVLDNEPTLVQMLVFYFPVILLLVVSVIGLVLINQHLRKVQNETLPLVMENQTEDGI